MSCRLLVAIVFVCLPVVSAAEQSSPTDPSREGVQFFEAKIRPLLAKRCFKCHGETKQRGGLRLDGLNAMLAGGESGPAMVPGKPDESLLIEAIRYESFEMPPDGPLPDEEAVAAAERTDGLGRRFGGGGRHDPRQRTAGRD